ncbi:MAG TPA: TfoX/Sxy family protein [Candidatus Doudnabacteria bacterium]|nr:TfoX/Sxy family protein [Candidatus Doudnabacteria bacterium]
MAATPAFLQYVMEDLFGNNPAIAARSMFGGFGLYFEDKIFGIIAGDELYFKADKSNVHHFISRGSQQFSYMKNGVEYKMSYWQVPAEIMENPHLLIKWAKESSLIELKG